SRVQGDVDKIGAIHEFEARLRRESYADFFPKTPPRPSCTFSPTAPLPEAPPCKTPSSWPPTPGSFDLKKLIATSAAWRALSSEIPVLCAIWLTSSFMMGSYGLRHWMPRRRCRAV